MRLILAKGEDIFIAGEARIRVIRGKIEVFGAELEAGKEGLIEHHFSAPLIALQDSEVEIFFGPDSYILQREGVELIPKSWRASVEEISKCPTRPCVVAVVGNVDSGKSGYLTFLANKLKSLGYRAFVLDTDTGQSEIGPPTTIGLGEVVGPIFKLSQCEFVDAFFVGVTSPYGVFDRFIAGSLKLLRKATRLGADFVLVNTTGWVFDRGGRELKLSKLIAIRPEYIVSITPDGTPIRWLSKAVNQISSKLISVESPVLLRERSREMRREIREEIYASEFEDAREVVISLDSVDVIYGFLGTGEEVDETTYSDLAGALKRTVYYAEVGEDFAIIFVDKQPAKDSAENARRILRKREILFLTPRDIQGLLVGLLGPNGEFLGLGIILGFEPRGRKLLIFTRARMDLISGISFGHMKLNLKFEEAGFVPAWSI